nr:putative reverse transcriptase domain-containing protein [Tanacetum cinerariifolium]
IDKVVLVKEKPKAVRDHQKSYVVYGSKPLEFEMGDHVLLKVTPRKGVVRFGKKGKLRLPEELNSVHNTFHVSDLKKCLADANLHVPLDEIKVDKTLRFVEKPIEIMDREIKKLKRGLLKGIHGLFSGKYCGLSQEGYFRVSMAGLVEVCHEKVVRIPFEGDEILRVHGERTQGFVKTLMNTKTKKEHKVYLKLVLESLRKEKLYAKFSKYAAESVRDAIGFECCLASLSGWTKDWESSLTRLELVQETTNKVVLVKEKPKAVRDRQKSYVAYGRKPLEFEVGDCVWLKVTPWKGVVRFEKKGQQDTSFCQGTCKNYGSRIKKLKRRKIVLAKVRWNSKCGHEFTWEHEDQMRIKYPQLFMDRVVKPAS